MKDRELDAKIAELVFGWEDVQSAGDHVVGKAPTGHEAVTVPLYSTTWEGAGAVIEALQRLGYDIALSAMGEVGGQGDPQGAFHANVLPVESVTADDNVFESAETGARAVCMAAVAALTRRRPIRRPRDL